MIRPLRRVVVRRPGPEMAVENPESWNYASAIDLPRAQAQHDAFCALLEESGCELLRHQSDLPDLADALFVHDPCLITRHGAIHLRLGKALRRGESAAMRAFLEGQGIPTLADMNDEPGATAEGGDLLWVDEGLLAVGRSYRTNAAGIDFLRRQLQPRGVDLLEVSLPHGEGPRACLHLMSLISIVDRDLAVVHRPLLPVDFLEAMESRGMRWVEVPATELPSMGTNVLAVAPSDVILIEGNPVTTQRMREAGCRVRSFVGDELCWKAEGGPTCLTRPVLRASTVRSASHD
jgi:N-dimethylarginine dimethylaminohydrolase